MVTKKFRASVNAGTLAFLLIGVVGCSPPASQALLDGKRLLDKGQAGAAAIRLEVAARSMPTNAVAWSYLAVARHYSGSLSNAETAYHEALRLSPELAETRFGLGMLYWQQSQWAEAREQFASVTRLRPDHAMAWLRLGECQLRLNDVREGGLSLSNAVSLDPRSPEGWNWLGVAQVQARQWREAEGSFEKALQLQMNHGPALLNLAILRQQHLDHPREALDLYRQYIAFWPGAENVDDVRSAAAQLERRLAPPPAPPKTAPSGPSVSQTIASVTRSSNAPAQSAPPAPIRTPVTPAPQLAASTPAREPQRPPQPPADPVPAVEVSQAGNSAGRSAEPVTPVPPPKRGFFARLNPVNLFKGSPEPAAGTSAPMPIVASSPETALRRSASQASPPGIPAGGTWRRYAYRLDAPTARGRQEEARRLSQEAARLRLTGRLSEAAMKCREAIGMEPASYEAHFNLGLVLLQSGDSAAALPEFEDALLIDPESEAARYNFGLMLKQAGYPVDAALEMQRLLERDPADVRAHLMLGNLYDRPFANKGRARGHYLRVLELAPTHPEAGAIRFWLKENPL